VRSTGAKLNFKLEARQLGQALKRLPVEVRTKVARKGIRAWGKLAVRALRRAVIPQDLETRRDAALKVKTYKRGKVIWGAVGIRKDGARVGWRSHLWDGGFRVWQKGIKADGTPQKPVTRPGRNPNPRIVPFSQKRGWRDGKGRRNLGRRIGRTMYLSRTNARWQPEAGRFVRDAIEEAIRGL
jgi:hypothetical protein